MNREDVTAAILDAKRRKGLRWSDLASAIGTSKEWSTAALLGQMTLSQAQSIGFDAFHQMVESQRRGASPFGEWHAQRRLRASSPHDAQAQALVRALTQAGVLKK